MCISFSLYLSMCETVVRFLYISPVAFFPFSFLLLLLFSFFFPRLVLISFSLKFRLMLFWSLNFFDSQRKVFFPNSFGLHVHFFSRCHIIRSMFVINGWCNAYRMRLNQSIAYFYILYICIHKCDTNKRLQIAKDLNHLYEYIWKKKHIRLTLCK